MVDDLRPFEGPLAAIAAARENLIDFELGCKDFVAQCKYEVIRKYDGKTSEEVIFLRYSLRPPAILRAKAMSIISNSRHALDQAVCDAAITLGRKNSKGVYFPVGMDAADLEITIAKHCKNVHPGILDFLRACKPYYGGNDVIRFACKLANEKHSRIISLSLGGEATLLVSNENFLMISPFKFWINKWSYTSNELEYARVGPGGYINMDINHPVQVVLCEGHAPFKGSAAASLGAIVSECQSIILGLEAETSRIKLTT